MLVLYRTVGLRYIRFRWPRALLVTLSIALGVAAWVATGLLNSSLEKSIQSAASPLGGVADLYVTSGEVGVSRDLVETVAKVPGVKTVEPLIHEPIQVLLPDGTAKSAILLGMSKEAQETEETGKWGITVEKQFNLDLLGQFLLGRKFAFLGSGLLEALPSGTTDITIRAAGDLHHLARAGTVHATGPAATLGGFVLFMDCDDAGRILQKPGRVSRLDVILEAGKDPQQAKTHIQQALDEAAGGSSGTGSPYKVQTPQTREDQVRDVLVGVQVGFSLCGAGALVVGMFLVYNALAVSVTERSHDIGILRSLGATRGQVRSLFLGEAFLLGFLGTLLGVPFGLALGYLLLGEMQQVVSDIFLPLPAQDIVISWTNVVTGMLAGLATSLVAAWIPSAHAASQEPADAVRRVPPSPGLFYRLLQMGACTLLISTGLAGIYWKKQLPERWGAYGGLVLILVASMLATPLLAAVAARLVRPIARRLLGLEGRLAADNLVRAPGRTGLVIGALAASVGLLMQTAGVIRSNEDAVLDWLDHTVVPDLVVSSGGPFSASGQTLPMTLDVGKRIIKELAIPGTRVASVCFRNFQWTSGGKGTSILLVALDAETYYEANTERRSPIPFLDLFHEMAKEPGAAVVSNNFAEMHSYHTGDTINLPGVNGPVSLHIIGTIEDYSWNRGTVFVHQPYYVDTLDLRLVDLFHLYLPPGSSPEEVEAAREHLQKSSLGAEQALFALTRNEMREHILEMVRQLYGLAYRQLGVIGIVASLGVLSALMISVLQRQRELGLLRAVGASQLQVLRSVLAEAILMGGIGTLIGLVVGIPLQWYVVHVLLFEEAGFAFPVRIPWSAGGIIALLAMLAAFFAGVGPAIHAMRLKIAEAIAYE